MCRGAAGELRLVRVGHAALVAMACTQECILEGEAEDRGTGSRKVAQGSYPAMQKLLVCIPRPDSRGRQIHVYILWACVKKACARCAQRHPRCWNPSSLSSGWSCAFSSHRYVFFPCRGRERLNLVWSHMALQNEPTIGSWVQ